VCIVGHQIVSLTNNGTGQLVPNSSLPLVVYGDALADGLSSRPLYVLQEDLRTLLGRQVTPRLRHLFHPSHRGQRLQRDRSVRAERPLASVGHGKDHRGDDEQQVLKDSVYLVYLYLQMFDLVPADSILQKPTAGKAFSV